MDEKENNNHVIKYGQPDHDVQVFIKLYFCNPNKFILQNIED